MFLNDAVPEEPRQQRQRVIGQRAVDERLLPLQRFQSTATRESVVFERGPQLGFDTPYEVWVMRRDGSNLQLAARNARAPAWNPKRP